MSEVLWRPPADVLATSRLGRYLTWLVERGGPRFDSYEALHEWSVTDLEGFWRSVWEYFGVRSSQPFTAVVTDEPMPHAKWFTGARLNYAEHVLAHGGDRPALLGRSQTRADVDLTFGELRAAVARARAGLRRLGVGPGDTVAAYVPNTPEAVVLLLAAASLGATFASCAPEFGAQSVIQRFTQVRPKVLVVVDGYRHHGKAIDKRDAVATIRAALPDHTAVFLPYLDHTPIDGTVAWADFMASWAPLEFEAVEVDHPLYVLFSSGTTGIPKAIVHGHGRMVVAHLAVQGFQMDLGPDDRLLAPATTSWMVWNFGVSVLMHGASLVCFDGDPLWPSSVELWRLAEETEATTVTVGAAALLHTMKSGERPKDRFALPRLRSIGSTGSPLPAQGFRWVYEAIKDDVCLSSGSGGTDLCSGFVGGSPLHEVTAGEMACRYLGAPVESFDPDGRPLRDEPGELVLTQPMPCMPVRFLDDPDDVAYTAAYFDMFPGVWRHGDWITVTKRGTCVVTGRSDATLNRSGVRIGTAELYMVVDADPMVADSVVVHLEDDALLLLVVPAAGVEIGLADADRLRALVRSELSPRHVPDEIHVVPALPRTLTGKKLEVPIKKLLLGEAPDRVIAAGAVTHPEAVDALVALARERRRR